MVIQIFVQSSPITKYLQVLKKYKIINYMIAIKILKLLIKLLLYKISL